MWRRGCVISHTKVSELKRIELIGCARGAVMRMRNHWKKGAVRLNLRRERSSTTIWSCHVGLAYSCNGACLHSSRAEWTWKKRSGLAEIWVGGGGSSRNRPLVTNSRNFHEISWVTSTVKVKGLKGSICYQLGFEVAIRPPAPYTIGSVRSLHLFKMDYVRSSLHVFPPMGE